MEKIRVQIDGGSRRNPGPAAIGVAIFDGTKNFPRKYKECIGETTNNVAEYKAAIFALGKIKHLFGKNKIRNLEVEIESDSERVVNQQNGKERILDEKLKDLFIETWNLRVEVGFENVKFTLIPREQNSIADKLVNQALDGK